MKFLLAVLVLILFIGCQSSSKEPFDGMKEFRENNFDLKLTQDFYYKGIKFKMPKHFVKVDQNNFLIKSGDFSGKDSSINTYFSIEMFRPEEWNELMPEDSLPEILNLEEINRAYFIRRYDTYFNAGLSNITRLKLNYPNRFQIIAAKARAMSKEQYFATATLEVGNAFYIFQYIASRTLMDYVCDDFKRILKTVKQN